MKMKGTRDTIQMPAFVIALRQSEDFGSTFS